MMIYCKKYNLNLEPEFNCKNNCIFYKKEKCNYLKWIPGLKSGKDLTKEE